MAQATAGVRASSGRHKRGSTLTEMFKLAGDMVGDGMQMMMMGNTDDFLEPGQWDDYTEDGAETTDEDAMRVLQKEFRRSADEDSYSTTASEEERQERLLQIRKRDTDNIRRSKDVGDERELQLKQKLSQFEEEFLSDNQKPDADPDFTFHGSTTSQPQKKSSNNNMKELKERAERAQTALKTGAEQLTASAEQIFQVLSGDSNRAQGASRGMSSESSTEESTEYTEYTEEPEEEEEEDEFASQIVHEMMQLLHHSRKNRYEAERLIEYKRTFVRQRHETNPDLDAYIAKNANYKKLECSARRFVRHLQDGDVPKNEQTLSLEKELRLNVAAMRDIRRESDDLDKEFESMFDAAE